MIIDTIFESHTTHRCRFTVMQNDEVDGQIVGETEVELLIADCICYRGNIGQAYKSDKFKADCAATIILRPADCTVVIPAGCKATVDGVGVFSVMYVDDVAGQGLAIVVPCREYTDV